MEKESQKKISEIEDLTHLAKQKAVADAEFYKMQKHAEANQMKLTQEYLELMRIEAISKNNKIFYGPDIPSVFIESEFFQKSALNKDASKKESKKA